MERMNVSRIKQTEAAKQNDAVRDSLTQDLQQMLEDESLAEVPCSCPGCFSMDI